MAREEKEEEKQIIETIDEDGNIVNFELFDIIEFEGKEYALLIPIEIELENEDDESRVILMRLTKDGDGYLFEVLEDEDEFKKVSSYIENLANEEEDE
ncbi:MAG: DUF1292 domain-containing protein [Candidatus Gastranaerophilales bacterium]|nr:DUF1292 domain-containing protein [Candidatus Gastranaerophilales bacterium]